MAKASRSKGQRGEREARDVLPGAVKVSAMYKPGEDLEWMGCTVEVKRRAKGFAFDYKQLRDAQILLKRADRKQWLVTMEVSTLIDLMDGAFTDGWGVE